MVTAATYRRTIQKRIKLGANFRELRYGGVQLGLMPNINALGQQASGGKNSGDPSGTFLEAYKLWLPIFEIEEKSLPAACVDVGAVWEMRTANLFSGTATWGRVFVRKQPTRAALWYEVELARFITAANLVISYESPTGAYTTSEGNRVPVTESATATAVVSQQLRPSDQQLPGTPEASIYLEGYMVAPLATPSAMPVQQRSPATLNGMAGEFVVLPSFQAPIGVSAGSGDLLRGVFLFRAA